MSCVAASSATVLVDLGSVAERRATRSDGTNRRASASQLGTTDEGATTRNGPGAPTPSAALSCACAIRANAWMVLPNPMSSARIPPIRWRHSMASQFSPCCWYGRSSACSAAGDRPGLPQSDTDVPGARISAGPIGGGGQRLLEQGPQFTETLEVHGHQHAVVGDELLLPAHHRTEHGAERHRPALDGHGH